MNEQEFEKVMRQIATDAALDDPATDEIADSPALWWSVQREIRKAEPEKAPWPPNIFRRFLMIGVPVAAMLLIGIGIYMNGLHPASTDRAETVAPTTMIPNGNVAIPSDPVPDNVKTVATAKSSAREAQPVYAVAKTRKTAALKALVTKASGTATSEIKSDFIALAYARSPESGQLVRVKVPSSMMVQLGVVPTVSDPSKLIDAEVLVGDDGLTQSIRFIRQ